MFSLVSTDFWQQESYSKTFCSCVIISLSPLWTFPPLKASCELSVFQAVNFNSDGRNQTSEGKAVPFGVIIHTNIRVLPICHSSSLEEIPFM